MNKLTQEQALEIAKNKMEELSAFCKENSLAVVGSVYSDELVDGNTLTYGKNYEFVTMMGEIIKSAMEDFVQDMKETEPNTSEEELNRMGFDFLVGDIEEYVFINDYKPFRVTSPVPLTLAADVSEKVEAEIGAVLKETLIGPPLNKDLIKKAEERVKDILKRNMLHTKIAFKIVIAPDGVADVYFSAKAKLESLN